MLFSGQYGQLFFGLSKKTLFLSCLLKTLTRKNSMGMCLCVKGGVHALEGKHGLFLYYC